MNDRPLDVIETVSNEALLAQRVEKEIDFAEIEPLINIGEHRQLFIHQELLLDEGERDIARGRLAFAGPRRRRQLPREEAQTIVKVRPLQGGERRRSPYQVERDFFFAFIKTRHANKLLAEDVQRGPDRAHRLDSAFESGLFGDDGAGEFRIFWIAALISNTGGWMQNAAIPYVIFQLTDRNGGVGVAGFWQYIPIMVVGADPAQLAQIDELISLWDQPESPESKTVRITKVFQIRYSKAKVISDAIKDVYRDLLSSNDPSLQSKGNDKQPPQGGQSTSYVFGRSSNDSSKKEEPKDQPIRFKGLLSIGVDEISNTIVVSSASGLLEDISQLITTLDEAAKPDTKFKVVPLSPTRIEVEVTMTADEQGLEIPYRGSYTVEKVDDHWDMTSGTLNAGSAASSADRPFRAPCIHARGRRGNCAGTTSRPWPGR